MNKKLIGLIIVSAIWYIFGQGYIGFRYWEYFGGYFLPVFQWLYWLLFISIAFIYPLGRLGNMYYPGKLSDFLIKAGLYWLALSLYMQISLIAIDGIRMLDTNTGITPSSIRDNPQMFGWISLIFAVAVIIYGTVKAHSVQVRTYQLKINKPAGKLKKLNMAVLADLHLGLIVGPERLKEILKKTKELKPDIIVFPGDVIDESIGAFIERRMPAKIAELKAKYGVYGVLGNHEYIWGHSEKANHYLKKLGIIMLKDQVVKVADSFYLVGRDDALSEYIIGKPRKPLAEMLAGLDKSLPIIMLDHQPYHLEESIEHQIDLELSGHTHGGQFFPINFFTKATFAIHWGYMKKGNFQIIVSSGLGTWGPPIRVGTVPELVNVIIEFSSSG